MFKQENVQTGWCEDCRDNYNERNVEAIAMIKEINGEEEGNFKISLQCMAHSSCHLKSVNEVFVIVR